MTDRLNKMARVRRAERLFPDSFELDSSQRGNRRGRAQPDFDDGSRVGDRLADFDDRSRVPDRNEPHRVDLSSLSHIKRKLAEKQLAEADRSENDFRRRGLDRGVELGRLRTPAAAAAAAGPASDWDSDSIEVPEGEAASDVNSDNDNSEESLNSLIPSTYSGVPGGNLHQTYDGAFHDNLASRRNTVVLKNVSSSRIPLRRQAARQFWLDQRRRHQVVRCLVEASRVTCNQCSITVDGKNSCIHCNHLAALGRLINLPQSKG